MNNVPAVSRVVVVGVMLAFFATGFSALLYQVIWQRMLVLFTGSDVHSASLVISAFLAGLGVGSWAGLRFADRCSPRRALQVYGVADLLVAAFAVASPWLFADVLYAGSLGQSHGRVWLWLQLFAVLLLPTFLMGLSLPMVSRALAVQLERVPAAVSRLNGLNIIGAAAGCVVGIIVLAPRLGFTGALQVGALISAGAGLLALVFSFGLSRHAPAVVAVPAVAAPSAAARVSLWAGLFFISGFMAISLQLVWFRVTVVLTGATVFVYALLLACFLLFDGIGSLLATRWQWRSPWRTFLLLQVLIAAWAGFSVWMLPIAAMENKLWLPFVLLGPSALLIGATFPVVQRAVHDDLGRVGRRVGLLQLANLAGNVLAGLLTGLVLLHWLGSAAVFRLALCLGVLAAALLLHDVHRASAGRQVLLPGLGVLLMSGMAVFFPAHGDFWRTLYRADAAPGFHVAEDASAVVAIREEAGRSASLSVNGEHQGSIPFGSYHMYIGLLPALLHPDPQQALVIGLGSGATAYGVGGRESLTDITVVELIAAQYPLHERYLAERPYAALGALFADARYRWLRADGRRLLAAQNREYDIIQADAIMPHNSGAGFLYSREFFELVRSRLKPGGIMAQWSPTPRTEATFRSVFPHALRLPGNLLIGSNAPFAIDERRLYAALESPFVTEHLGRAGFADAFRQGVIAMMSEGYRSLADQPPSRDYNSDWWPKDEFGLFSQP